MNISTKIQLNRALQSEAKLVLAALSQSEQAVLVEQRPGEPSRHILDEEADRLVRLGLAVRTPMGVDLTMLGRIAANVAYESRASGARLGGRRA